MHVAMLAYPKLTQLDLTGPYEVLARFPELSIDLVWKSLGPIDDALELRLTPTRAFADCPPADILFVPGGPGQLALMQDTDTLAFLRAQAQGARWITSVCTGSLVLAAAGLLTGYRATCHWMSIDQLAMFGCTPVSERVVLDGNRLTGAGVTSGIDFALTLGAELFGEDRASAFNSRWNIIPPLRSGPDRPPWRTRKWSNQFGHHQLPFKRVALMLRLWQPKHFDKLSSKPAARLRQNPFYFAINRRMSSVKKCWLAAVDA
ncbi:ThiJ/PfpI domain-containing protein [Novosphingobium sp. Rr 2-17]|uniref:DJ-1/PfpI family protein n=1 Tax=Novosphingobium sp. Rr 2-17 TaxID=555793 RepID=UPI0002699F19|nr:DJ-1/PfpI family protein [Novosphingobium sp. Rr 2-17]EIZ77922.1 ThiJ/PfpI domain-containing protein [Novosphingobium sp. Rr 2-17]